MNERTNKLTTNERTTNYELRTTNNKRRTTNDERTNGNLSEQEQIIPANNNNVTKNKLRVIRYSFVSVVCCILFLFYGKQLVIPCLSLHSLHSTRIRILPNTHLSVEYKDLKERVQEKNPVCQDTARI